MSRSLKLQTPENSRPSLANVVRAYRVAVLTRPGTKATEAAAKSVLTSPPVASDDEAAEVLLVAGEVLQVANIGFHDQAAVKHLVGLAAAHIATKASPVAAVDRFSASAAFAQPSAPAGAVDPDSWRTHGIEIPVDPDFLAGVHANRACLADVSDLALEAIVEGAERAKATMFDALDSYTDKAGPTDALDDVVATCNGWMEAAALELRARLIRGEVRSDELAARVLLRACLAEDIFPGGARALATAAAEALGELEAAE